MCIFMEDDDDGGGESGGGGSKPQLQQHHTWLIPRRAMYIVMAAAIILFFMGMVLMAIGGGIGSTGLKVTGGIMFGLGIVGCIVCLLVCLYAYFFYGTRDQEVQTTQTQMQAPLEVPTLNGHYIDDFSEAPGYASIGRPSALKSADSTLRRNGAAGGPKKVTMAPDVGPYGESPPNGGNIAHQVPVQHAPMPTLQVPSPTSQGGHAHGQGHGQGQGQGQGGRPQFYAPSTASSVVSGSARSSSTSEVGTGGIRVVPLDGGQPFPSPGSSVYQSASHTGGPVVYSGGGGSSIGSSIDTYAYPRSIPYSNGQESGFSDQGSSRSYIQDSVSLDGGSSSQYSTLRSIPVTHIISDSQRQQQQQQQQSQQQQQQQQQEVQYARVNKPGRSSVSPQPHYVVQGGGQNVHNVNVSHQQQNVNVSHQQDQSQQKFPVNFEDMDYDNPVERTPMIPAKAGQPPHSNTYHEQQMAYQRHRHHDIHAPRQVNNNSLHREYAANPYALNHNNSNNIGMQQNQHGDMSQNHNNSNNIGMQQNQHGDMSRDQHGDMSHQHQNFNNMVGQNQHNNVGVVSPQHQHSQLNYVPHQQQQQQHQVQYHTSSSSSSKVVQGPDDELPEPQPLVYPSARRPMTFEQISSSKMSMYDNVLTGIPDEEDE